MRISKMLFTNTPLDELNEELESVFDSIDDPQICHICTCNFSLLNTKYTCFICRMPVCLKDSTFHSLKSRICDNCQHELLVEEIWSEKKSFKDQIIQNIQETLKENNDKKALIDKESTKIAEFKEKIVEFQIQAEEELAKMQKFADELEKVNDEVEKNIDCMRKDEDAKVEFEKLMVEKLAKSHEHLQMMRIEIEELQQEKSELQKELGQVDEPIKEEELDEVFRSACKACKSQVRPSARNADIESKVCNCRVF